MAALESYNAFLQGDEDALTLLVSYYGDILHHFVMRYLQSDSLAEEVVEDTFVALLLGRKRFSAEGQLRTYLYRVARSKAVDRLRLVAREISLCEVEKMLPSDMDAADDPAALVICEERNAAVRRCMAAIAPQYREVLVLFYFENLNFDEVCRVTGKSRKQIYNRLTRARAAMKELLIREGISNANF